MRKSLCIYALALCLVLVSFPASAQEPDLVVQWLVQVNQARFDAGLAPYRLSDNLSAAAQRHADDVATNGFTNPGDVHQGSDGTHEQERVADTGYAAWTWTDGTPVVDENVWSGQGTVDDAMAFFLGSPVHRNNILSSRYREIGVGIATNGDTFYYVLVFGVRPNVLPIFINDGAATTDNSTVAIRLTNEEARPDGEGTDKMGRAIEVRISDERDWDSQPWQSWSDYVPWTLPETSGEHAVYVQFRDAAGRVAESVDTIVLEGEGPVEPTPIPPTDTPEPTATPEPTSTPEPTTMPEPTLVPEPTATFTVEPSPTAALTAAPFVPSSSPQVGPSPFPTWTPLPTSAPPPSQSSESRLPFCLLGALQALVVLFGLYLILRRGRGGQSNK